MKWLAVISVLLFNCSLLRAQTGPSLTLNGMNPSGVLVDEGDTLEACVEYTESPSTATTVVLTTRDGDGGGAKSASGDYEALIVDLEFGPSLPARQCRSTSINQDSVVEEFETFNVLATVDGVDITGSPGNVVIQTDSSDTVTVGFAQASYSVNEDEGGMACVVIKNGGIETNVVVTFMATDGSATESNDYSAAGFNTLTRTISGDTPAGGECFPIPVTDDDIIEPDESYTITLNSADTRVMFEEATRTTTIVIVNDDGPAECPAPPALTNGDFVLSGDPPSMRGDTAMYSCNSGYALDGVDTLTCELGDMWSPAAPGSCLRDCGGLTAPPNGAVEHPQTTAGSTATYSCMSGYDIDGEATRMCQADGTWSGTEPTCELSTTTEDPTPTDTETPTPTDTETPTPTDTETPTPTDTETPTPVTPSTGGQQSLTQDQMIGIGVGVGLAVLVILILVIVAVVVIILYNRHRKADKYVLNYSTVYGNQNKPAISSQPVEPNVYEERSVDAAAAEPDTSLKPNAPDEAESEA